MPTCTLLFPAPDYIYDKTVGTWYLPGIVQNQQTRRFFVCFLFRVFSFFRFVVCAGSTVYRRHVREYSCTMPPAPCTTMNISQNRPIVTSHPLRATRYHLSSAISIRAPPPAHTGGRPGFYFSRLWYQQTEKNEKTLRKFLILYMEHAALKYWNTVRKYIRICSDNFRRALTQRVEKHILIVQSYEIKCKIHNRVLLVLLLILIVIFVIELIVLKSIPIISAEKMPTYIGPLFFFNLSAIDLCRLVCEMSREACYFHTTCDGGSCSQVFFSYNSVIYCLDEPVLTISSDRTASTDGAELVLCCIYDNMIMLSWYLNLPPSNIESAPNLEVRHVAKDRNAKLKWVSYTR